jgi:hypothetical protein
LRQLSSPQQIPILYAKATWRYLRQDGSNHQTPIAVALITGLYMHKELLKIISE